MIECDHNGVEPMGQLQVRIRVGHLFVVVAIVVVTISGLLGIEIIMFAEKQDDNRKSASAHQPANWPQLTPICVCTFAV